MKISKNTEMLLFRYKSYAKNEFIQAHQDVLSANGYVWMLKVGKRTSLSKIEKVLESGGWLILRSPKSEGGKSYIAHFDEVSENQPQEVYPQYYNDILSDEENLYFENLTYQWFKISSINELPESCANELLMSNSEKKVKDVIDTTRTAVMYIKNGVDIEL